MIDIAKNLIVSFLNIPQKPYFIGVYKLIRQSTKLLFLNIEF